MNPAPFIIYEDECIVVLDKPAGMPSTSLTPGEEGTLASWLISRYPAQAAVGPDPREAGLANRLDNETSGLLIAARTAKAHASLRNQFSQNAVRKRYLALVIGSPPDRGIIETPIAHHPTNSKKMLACETPGRASDLGGRPAHTSFEALERLSFKGMPYALISVMIKSGVRHQIRVHLASEGFPISGDRLYRNPKKRAADPLDPPRQMLHSARLTVRHPEAGAAMTFESPLPEDFRQALSMLALHEKRR